MKPVHTRPAVLEDCQQFVDWEAHTPGNAMDPGVLTYPSSDVVVACTENGQPLVYLPRQRPLMLESLGVRPGASCREVAAGLWSLLQDAVATARREGSGEILFAASEPTLPVLAQRYGFEKMQFTVYRARVNGERQWLQPEQEQTGLSYTLRSIASRMLTWLAWRSAYVLMQMSKKLTGSRKQ